MSFHRSVPGAWILLPAAVSAFVVGTWVGARQAETTLDEFGARLDRLEQQSMMRPAATGGFRDVEPTLASAKDGASSAFLVESVRSRLVEEMGLLSPTMLRERRGSFAELYASGRQDDTTYGTASYLGAGYFITVKHAVANEAGEHVPFIRLRIGDDYARASVVDVGAARGEVDPGDWAILKIDAEPAVRPLRINLHYAYPFADPVARMGNDYSRGIIATTGHVGQHRNGLVTCLTDGHPGVSGGGVLDRAGDLVGIQVGRLDGDFRFSFILPLRAEMFRALRDVPLAFAGPNPAGRSASTDSIDADRASLSGSIATGGRAHPD